MIIPIIIIKQVIGAIILVIALWLLWRSKLMRPVRLKLKELRIRFHGRPAALERAKRRALKLSKKENKRYRIYFLGMRYRVLHRDDIRAYKRIGFFNRHINVTNTEALVFFDTANPDI